MTTMPSCEPSQTTEIAAEPLSVAEAVTRFEREATCGVCDTGRYRCGYFTWGEGPPLLCIHGMGDHARSLLLPISRLARHFRCIAYELPSGRGDGARMRHYRHAHLVADAFAVLDHLGIRQSYVFGMSFGSTVALAALREQPERLPRAVLQGGFARRPLTSSQQRLARLATFLPGPLNWLPFRVKVLRHGHSLPFAARPREFWDHFLRTTSVPYISAMGHHALLIQQVDLRPLLPEVRQPVLMICGDRDPLVGRTCEEELLRGLPNVGRVEVPTCGHFPNFSHPELVAELVRRFLTPPPCGADTESDCSQDSVSGALSDRSRSTAP